ncbi:hypothetical protein, partial [Ligilactobacillus salivarius]|uniref:hypothetical protein n=1 Tax=Ligilactobacillus salivarius TaxID=1624 RepID=UPI0024B8F288
KTIRLPSNSLKIIIKILASVLFDKEPHKTSKALRNNIPWSFFLSDNKIKAGNVFHIYQPLFNIY